MSAALDHLKTRNKKCKNDADDRRGNYVSQNPPNPRKRLAKIGTRFVWIECPAALWTTAGIARLIELCVTFSAIHQASFRLQRRLARWANGHDRQRNATIDIRTGNRPTLLPGFKVINNGFVASAEHPVSSISVHLTIIITRSMWLHVFRLQVLHAQWKLSRIFLVKLDRSHHRNAELLDFGYIIRSRQSCEFPKLQIIRNEIECYGKDQHK